MDGWIDGSMDRWIDASMDQWMDGFMHVDSVKVFKTVLGKLSYISTLSDLKIHAW